MKASTHIGISTIAAVSAYKLTGSQTFSISLFLSGIFIDLDHVVDYMLLSKERFTIKNFFSWYDEHRWQRVFIVLHSYELITIFSLIACLLKNEIMIGMSLGFLLHIMLDQIGNMTADLNDRKSPWFYFFLYRYAMSFEKNNYLER